MEFRKPTIKWQKARDDLLITDDLKIYLESKALLLRFPFGGFVWNRPTAIRVESLDHQETKQINDITRNLIFFIIGSSLVLMSSILLASRFGKASIAEE